MQNVKEGAVGHVLWDDVEIRGLGEAAEDAEYVGVGEDAVFGVLFVEVTRHTRRHLADPQHLRHHLLTLVASLPCLRRQIPITLYFVKSTCAIKKYGI